jgi:hypothetical protein
MLLGAALASCASLVVAGAAAAGDPDIGCGPGTEIWLGNTGVAPKVLGATTNGSFGLQTFGITFETFECGQGKVRKVAVLHTFAAANLDRLARDMARGDGEMLRAFAHLMGVAESDRPAFYAFTKAHFAEIFAGEVVTERDVIGTLSTLMADDATLSAYVGS